MQPRQLELKEAGRPSWRLSCKEVFEACRAAGHQSVAQQRAMPPFITVKDGKFVVEKRDAEKGMAMVLIQPVDHPFCIFLLRACRARTLRMATVMLVTEYATQACARAFAEGFARRLEDMHPELSAEVEDCAF